jgi:hypothetical protein
MSYTPHRPWLDALLADARREQAARSEAARRDWKERVREATLAADGDRLRAVVEEGRAAGFAR